VSCTTPLGDKQANHRTAAVSCTTPLADSQSSNRGRFLNRRVSCITRSLRRSRQSSGP
jgi:hypothetical protein